jgi:hypothetical protein
MSTINTNGIDVNYPIPGVNNNSQGFRNNFTAIKNNLNTAASEITDLENKVVLKTALANTILNNDMANTLISNASTLQFRATTYNLGNSLSGTVLVNCSLGDVQYGTLGSDITLTFGSWAPTDTQSTLQLQLSRPNNEVNYSITFPSEVIFTDDNHGVVLLENYSNIGNVPSITFPYNSTQINLKLTSNDCGDSIFVQPLNRPFQTTQIQQRSPSPTGFLGDVAGTVAVDANYLYVCTDTFDSTLINANANSTTTGSDIITFDSLPGNVVLNMPVVFDTMVIDGNSVTEFGNINSGQVYYVKTVSGSNITISDTRTGGTAGNTLALTTVTANAGNTNMDATFYSGSNIWKRVELNTW